MARNEGFLENLFNACVSLLGFVILFVILFTLSYSFSALYLWQYTTSLESSLNFHYPLNFNFLNETPFCIIDHLNENSQWFRPHRSDVVQVKQAIVQLEFQESPINLEQGKFTISLELYSAKHPSGAIFKSIRTIPFQYSSPLVRFSWTLVNLLPLVFGVVRERQIHNVEFVNDKDLRQLLDFHRNIYEADYLQVKLHQNGKSLEVSKAELHIFAELNGISYYMFYYKYPIMVVWFFFLLLMNLFLVSTLFTGSLYWRFNNNDENDFAYDKALHQQYPSELQIEEVGVAKDGSQQSHQFMDIYTRNIDNRNTSRKHQIHLTNSDGNIKPKRSLEDDNGNLLNDEDSSISNTGDNFHNIHGVGRHPFTENQNPFNAPEEKNDKQSLSSSFGLLQTKSTQSLPSQSFTPLVNYLESASRSSLASSILPVRDYNNEDNTKEVKKEKNYNGNDISSRDNGSKNKVLVVKTEDKPFDDLNGDVSVKSEPSSPLFDASISPNIAILPTSSSSQQQLLHHVDPTTTSTTTTTTTTTTNIESLRRRSSNQKKHLSGKK